MDYATLSGQFPFVPALSDVLSVRSVLDLNLFIRHAGDRWCRTHSNAYINLSLSTLVLTFKFIISFLLGSEVQTLGKRLNKADMNTMLYCTLIQKNMSHVFVDVNLI